MSPMLRFSYKHLENWRSSLSRKPLILMGARQVGKTFLLKTFGKQEFESVVYANFEEDLNLHGFFDSNISPHKIIPALQAYFNIIIHPENTLIIFDEIQACPRALTSLKYFCEEASEYYVAAAGSLLGIKMGNQSGFPVGKVDIIHIYPLSFFEFLTALNKLTLIEFVKSIHSFDIIPTPLHEQLLELFCLYMYIGGMPEAVHHYIKTSNLPDIRTIQKAILKNYELDFAKHAPTHLIQKITLLWNAIPSQLAKENKKFIFSLLREGARAREYELAMQWLVDAGLIYRCRNLTVPRLPLPVYEEMSAFKIYQFDVGILGALSDLSSKILLKDNDLFTEFKGALTENVVTQMLIYSGFEKLFYWTSSNTAEVDFLLLIQDNIIPLEVKSGLSTKSKSLKVYTEKYHPPYVIRVSKMNLSKDGVIFNLPIYLLEHLPDLISKTENFA
jgi:predicted AAA+ superfamily ATPase